MKDQTYGYVSVQRYPFGESIYQMATVRVEFGRLLIHFDGGSWTTVNADRWYECHAFDGQGHEIAAYVNPHQPERTSIRPPVAELQASR